MYEIIKNVINSGNYELKDMLKKIDTIWIQGDITDEKRTELIQLAQEKANPENSFAPLQKQIDEAFKQIATLTETVNANAQGMAALKEAVEKLGGTVVTPEPEPVEEYPAYKQPTGAHDAYYKDDKATFDGNKYICIAPEGVACVWSPVDYPNYWQKVA